MRIETAKAGEHTEQARQTSSPRLVKAAHEFEAQMIKELLKPMTASDSLMGGDKDADGDAGSAGTLGEFATEALGQALSRAGGFGIANRIVVELSSHGTRPESARAKGDLNSQGRSFKND
jgi:Rod binding domain-containing protein